MQVLNEYTVQRLQELFREETGLFLRVYAGKSTVDPKIKLQDLNIIDGEIVFSNQMKIRTIEEKFKNINLKVQIASTDNSKLCDDNSTLASAIKKYSIASDVHKNTNTDSNKPAAGSVQEDQTESIDYKTMYAQKIVSGELDPNKTTYDEFVSIAVMFVKTPLEPISHELHPETDQFSEVKKWLSELENDENGSVAASIELINNASQDENDLDTGDLLTLLSTFVEHRWNGYEKHYLSIIEVIEDSADDFENMLALGSEIACHMEEGIVDRSKVIDIFSKAEIAAVNFKHYILLADLIVNTSDIADKEWARRVYEKAQKEIYSVNDLKTFVIWVTKKEGLADKEWGKRVVLENISKAQSVDDYGQLIQVVLDEAYLFDIAWGEQLIQDTEILCESSSDYNLLARYCYTLKNRSKELIIKSILMAESDQDKREIVITVCDFLDDDTWGDEIQNSTLELLKKKYQKPDIEELKKLYVDGIEKGEIDPSQVNFKTYVNTHKSGSVK